MIVKLLNEHHLEFLSFKRCCTGSTESTLVKFTFYDYFVLNIVVRR